MSSVVHLFSYLYKVVVASFCLCYECWSCLYRFVVSDLFRVVGSFVLTSCVAHCLPVHVNAFVSFVFPCVFIVLLRGLCRCVVVLFLQCLLLPRLCCVPIYVVYVLMFVCLLFFLCCFCLCFVSFMFA